MVCCECMRRRYKYFDGSCRSLSFFGVEGKEIAEEIVPFGSFSNQLGISGDTSVDQDGDVIAKQRILMAISNVSYPVTPGDSFRLIYTDGVNRVTMDLQVDGTYHVDIPAMGTIDASKMTFPQLKEKICSLVGTYYSYANPQLSLIGTGSFYVTVKGKSHRPIPIRLGAFPSFFCCFIGHELRFKQRCDGDFSRWDIEKIRFV